MLSRVGSHVNGDFTGGLGNHIDAPIWITLENTRCLVTYFNRLHPPSMAEARAQAPSYEAHHKKDRKTTQTAQPCTSVVWMLPQSDSRTVGKSPHEGSYFDMPRTRNREIPHERIDICHM